MYEEFKKFAMRGNVVDLAVGVIIGAAFTGIVNSLVRDVVMPPIGWALGGLDFTNFFLVLKGSAPAATLKAAQDAGDVTINYGVFVNAVINFAVVAIVLFLIVRWINRLTSPKTAAPADVPEDLKVLREIRDLLKTRAA